MKFKVGMRVRCNNHNDVATVVQSDNLLRHDSWRGGHGTEDNEWYESDNIVPITDDVDTSFRSWGTSPFLTLGGMHRYYMADWDTEDKPSLSQRIKKTMGNLTTLGKKLLDADVKALVKAGFLDESLEITEEGTEAILAHYLNANKKELAQEARKVLKEQKSEEEE